MSHELNRSGMRWDYALLSRPRPQSTSDQQNLRQCAPIAASAPTAVTPEQGAVWAYPLPADSSHEAAFTPGTRTAPAAHRRDRHPRRPLSVDRGGRRLHRPGDRHVLLGRDGPRRLVRLRAARLLIRHEPLGRSAARPRGPAAPRALKPRHQPGGKLPAEDGRPLPRPSVLTIPPRAEHPLGQPRRVQR